MVVISCHTFEHLIDPRETIGELVKKVEDGGLLLVEVPYEFIGLVFRRAVPTIWHIQHFGRSSLHALLSGAGLSVASVRTTPGNYRGSAMYVTTAIGIKVRGEQAGRSARDYVWPPSTS